MDTFLHALALIPSGYSKGVFVGARYGITVERLGDGRQVKLYAEELGGNNHISFNLYLPRSGKVLLKPCEMPANKVRDFVLGVKLD